MLNAGCFKPNGPLTTEFLLMKDYKDNPCPRFYGKVDDKKKVYHQLKEKIMLKSTPNGVTWNVIVVIFQRCDSVKQQET